MPMAVRTLDAPDFLTSHQTWYGDMPIVARLAPGIPVDQAAAVVDGVLRQLDASVSEAAGRRSLAELLAELPPPR